MTDVKDLAKLICDFCFETIRGHESGLYKAINTGLLDIGINTLLTPNMKPIIMNITANYLNNAFVSLIKRNDPYIIEKFDAMCKIKNHSVICLLHIIMAFIQKVHFSLDRTKLDISSYENYMKSVSSQLDPIVEETLNSLIKSISHQCNGIDIKTCDPNIPLFVMKPAI